MTSFNERVAEAKIDWLQSWGRLIAATSGEYREYPEAVESWSTEELHIEFTALAQALRERLRKDREFEYYCRYGRFPDE